MPRAPQTKTVIIIVEITERECVNCGRWFYPPHVRKPVRNQQLAVVVSGRVTCGKRCANAMRGEAVADHIDRLRREQPEEFNRHMANMKNSQGRFRS